MNNEVTVEPSATPEVILLLAQLETLLKDEQRAVAAYDVATLETICDAKDDVLARLRSAAVCQDHEMLKEAGRRVTALAEANAAMFKAAVTAVRETLGITQAEATYDSRARLRNGYSGTSSRVL